MHTNAYVCACVCVCTRRRTLRAGGITQLALLYWLHVNSYLSSRNSGHLRVRILIVNLCNPSSTYKAGTLWDLIKRDCLNQVPEESVQTRSPKLFRWGRHASFSQTSNRNKNRFGSSIGRSYPGASQSISLLPPAAIHQELTTLAEETQVPTICPSLHSVHTPLLPFLPCLVGKGLQDTRFIGLKSLMFTSKEMYLLSQNPCEY